jgi:hypothetical protein
MAILPIFRLFGTFYGHFANFPAIWYILWLFWYNIFDFGMLHQEKSGNLAPEESFETKKKKKLKILFFAFF